LDPSKWTTSQRYSEAQAMARWNVLPSEWDELDAYDKAFMLEFIRTESNIDSANDKYRGKKSTFIVGLGVDDNG